MHGGCLVSAETPLSRQIQKLAAAQFRWELTGPQCSTYCIAISAEGMKQQHDG